MIAWSVTIYPFGAGEALEHCGCGATASNHVNATGADSVTGKVHRRYAAMCAVCALRAKHRTEPPPEPVPCEEAAS